MARNVVRERMVRACKLGCEDLPRLWEGLTIMIDVRKAMLDPTMMFEAPEQVVTNDELTRDQKIEILRRWEYDAHQLEVAEEEAGMRVRCPGMFDRVVQALHTLGVDRDTEHTPPTK